MRVELEVDLRFLKSDLRQRLVQRVQSGLLHQLRRRGQVVLALVDDLLQLRQFFLKVALKRLHRVRDVGAHVVVVVVGAVEALLDVRLLQRGQLVAPGNLQIMHNN